MRVEAGCCMCVAMDGLLDSGNTHMNNVHGQVVTEMHTCNLSGLVKIDTVSLVNRILNTFALQVNLDGSSDTGAIIKNLVAGQDGFNGASFAIGDIEEFGKMVKGGEADEEEEQEEGEDV